MPQPSTRIDPADTLVMFLDLQEGIVELCQTQSLARLRQGVHALAALARIFRMPAIVSGVTGADGQPPRMISELAAELGPYTVYQRLTADSLRNEAIVAAIKASGRQTLLIAGVSTEVAVQLPALTAADLGYRAFIVIDAIGGMSERTEQAAVQRIIAAGGSTVSVMTLAGELAGDFRSAEAPSALGILYEMAQAH